MIGGQKLHNSRYSLKLIIVLWYYQQRERTKFSFSIINRTFYYAPHNAAPSPFLQFSYQNRSSMRVTIFVLTKIYKYRSFFTHTLFFLWFPSKRGKKKRMWRKGILSSFLVSPGRLLITLGQLWDIPQAGWSLSTLSSISDILLDNYFKYLYLFPYYIFTLYHGCSLLDRFHLGSFICHM